MREFPPVHLSPPPSKIHPRFRPRAPPRRRPISFVNHGPSLLGRSPPHAPTHNANGPDGGLRQLQSPPRLKFFPEGRPSSQFCPWFLDVDGSGAAGGSMIRHAPEAALFPVDPLPVPVIEPSFRAVLVFPVGTPHLLASHPASAPLPAVDLPPVAGMTDVEHHSATRPSAKQLDPCHFAGHTPHDSIAACEPCRVGGEGIST